MLKIYTLTIAILLISYMNVQAQVKETKTNSNGWYMYSGNHRFANKWSLHTIIHVRRSNVITDWQQSLNRIGINYLLNNNVTMTIGYDFIVNFPYGKLPIPEKTRTHSSWEAITITHEIGKLRISHRYRLEQLWNTKLSKINYNFYNQFRYMLTVSVPIYKKVFFSFFDEVFFAFGKNVYYNNFNQNRLYGALGHRIKNGDVQIGYMNQFIKKGVGLTYENDNTLMVGLNYSFDLRKKKE